MSASPPGIEVIQLTIPSRLELLPLVDQLTAGISERLCFDEESRVQISISVLEAGTNAMRGSLSPFMAYLSREAELSDAELEELRGILRKHEPPDEKESQR